MQIENHTFLITGGGSGLGAACVREFAGAGANVIVADVNAATGEALASELGEQVVFSETDVTNEDSVKATMTLAKERFGGLHVAINCAGVAIAERLLGKNGPHALASFSKVITVNLIGTFNVARLAAALIASGEPSEAGERGVIINTASIAAFDGQSGQSAYGASKGGVAAMTLPLARDLARHGIRVVTIAPGIFDTPMLAGLPEPARASLGQQVPFPPRLGRPSEYAALAHHIVLNEMLNGEIIRLDGGLRMSPN
jgi:NAD(P)-dependent dehydrogenase (short-subunit alcohol dehydrogenase family)